jgi:predicted outer membrane repeat protein
MGVRRGRFRFGGLAVALLCLLVPAAAQATTFDVTNTNDSGDGSLRQAILDANATEGDDDIDATSVSGTIDLQSALPSLSESVDVTGPGPDQLTVRRDAGGDYRIFDIGQGVISTISGLTVADGSVSGNGGGILNAGGLTVQNSVIAGNHAGGDGGGIYGSVKLVASRVSGNSAGGSGGGIYCELLCGVTATGSTIADNTAASAGGIFGAITLDGTTVSGNSATGEQGRGGGLLAVLALKVVDSVITGNTATGNGGGIEAVDLSGDVTSSEVSNNSAGGRGGGLYAGFLGAITVTNGRVTGNSAGTYGGGIQSDGWATLESTTVSENSAVNGGGLVNFKFMEMTNTTVTENTATEQGGGILSRPSSALRLDVTSSTIARNSATTGANFFQVEGLTNLTNTILSDPIGSQNCAVDDPIASHGYNLADDDSCFLDEPTDQSGVDALLWPLADNGGPTETMIPASASPAIDQGFASDLTTDQRG